MRHKALLALLSEKMNQGATSILSGLADASGKTKDMVTLLTKMGVANKKLLLVVAKDMEKAVRATRNIENVEIRQVSALSALDVIKSEHVILADEALKQIK
jgi:ribosomal protein L4